ncbi:hypothetical protein KM043_012400 [Ampulex compressa]|nr:hypothetical protein KM043_012400 [Ampulex compressa]
MEQQEEMRLPVKVNQKKYPALPRKTYCGADWAPCNYFSANYYPSCASENVKFKTVESGFNKLRDTDDNSRRRETKE